nr:protein d1 [Quercus suber]
MALHPNNMSFHQCAACRRRLRGCADFKRKLSHLIDWLLHSSDRQEMLQSCYKASVTSTHISDLSRIDRSLDSDPARHSSDRRNGSSYVLLTFECPRQDKIDWYPAYRRLLSTRLDADGRASSLQRSSHLMIQLEITHQDSSPAQVHQTITMAPASKSIEAALTLAKTGGEAELQLIFEGKTIPATEYLPKKDAQTAPTLAVNSAGTGPYIAICLDIDAPFPSLPVLGPILHWIQPGLIPSTGADGSKTLTAPGVPFVADYIGPAPPPGSGPHRYVFFLYDQPADFDAKKWAPAGGKPLATYKRMRYSLADFEKEAKLGSVIAANYFTSN